VDIADPADDGRSVANTCAGKWIRGNVSRSTFPPKRSSTSCASSIPICRGFVAASAAADIHFTQGVDRLTRIHIGEPRHFRLTDPRLFDHPWLYATQVGYWDLDDAEIRQLQEYFRRGGFLVVDDFYGDADWEVFQQSMRRALPGRPIVDLDESDSLLHVLYTITERTMIPGLRHLRRGPNGTIVVQPQGPPHWRAIYDEKGRLMVAINHNMDVGDAWEHADMPEYPEAMTALAYRFGINYIIYSMTH
jgi:hypothetical protein